jgi:hypothetical protein
MDEGNTFVNTPGAWFVYKWDPDEDMQEHPVGVFDSEDELFALRAANQRHHYCIWWPYGLSFMEADKEWWDRA